MKIYVKGNFLIYIESDSNVWTSNLEDVILTKNGITSTSYNLFFKSTNKLFSNIPFSSIYDESGSAYSSQSVFETYIYTNTGIRTSSGSSATNNETGVAVEGTLSTNLPLTTQGLNFVASRCMGGGGGITNSGQFDLGVLGVYSI
jgi:hypothetical protein